MKRRMALLLVVLTVVSCSPVAAAADKGIQVAVAGEPVEWTDARPFLDENDRTLVPLRAVAEAMKLDVTWDGAQEQATFSRTDYVLGEPVDMSLTFTIGSRTASYDSYLYNNGIGVTRVKGTVAMDTAAVLRDSRTYAPIRYLAEFFGYPVAWHGKTETVYVGSYSLLAQGDFSGYYDGNGYVSVVREGSSYQIEVELYRLTSLSGSGTARGGILYFTAQVSSSGDTVEAMLCPENDRQLQLVILQSGWGLLEQGQTFQFSY